MQQVRVRGETRRGFWWGNLRKRDHLEDPGVDGRVILRCIFRKWDGTGLIWLRIRGNEPSGSIKCGEFIDQLRTGQLLKKDCAPWSKCISQNSPYSAEKENIFRTEQKTNVTTDRAYSRPSEKSETALVERRMRLKFASGFMRMFMATIMAGSRGIVQKSAL